ncbi:hypothetical protein, partial [Acidomonas methanolica]
MDCGPCSLSTLVTCGCLGKAFSRLVGSVAQIEFWLWTSHSGTYDLLNNLGEWDSERGELIEDRDTQVEL